MEEESGGASVNKRVALRVFTFAASALLTLFSAAPAGAQDRLYWDFPDPIERAEGGRFPTMVAAGERLALIWQEFSGEAESLDATIALKVMFSDDGRDWSGPAVTIAENLPYLWMEEVPLFSAASDDEGNLVAAVAVASEGVALYRQEGTSENPSFRRAALIPSGTEAADVAVAPKISFVKGAGFRLFLTRRTSIEGASRPTTLSIFLSESADGNSWTDPVLFIDPLSDRSINGEILEQNFLPSHFVADGNEYVVFQSLRQGDEGQVYQIYIKVKESGEPWGPAKAITESITPSDGNDPLLWDNERPHGALNAEGEILIAWERRRGREVPNISAVTLDLRGNILSRSAETVTNDRHTSANPRIANFSGATWILWFDDTGIRLAKRNASGVYGIQAASLDAHSAGAVRGSAAFPRAVEFKNQTYVFWQDRTIGQYRSVFLRPDLYVDPPELTNANFLSGRPGNNRTLVVNWRGPEDSSGILSYSWIWSRNPDAVPSRLESDRIYGEYRAVFEIENPQKDEGNWYFALSAQDQAGNWSEPLRLIYTLDITPPPPPIILSPPKTDAYGYLRENTFDITWTDGEDDPAAYYRWRMDYLASSPESLDLERLEAVSLADARRAFFMSGGTESAETTASWFNIDNGVWAFTVAAIDEAGNEGLPNSQILFTNRYVPVTFITDVTSRRDEADRIVLHLIGRGFSVGGLLDEAVIDRDGQEPWDYVYKASDGKLNVSSDRIADIVGIDDMEKGTYRIGVRHPTRGLAWWDRTMRLDSIGNVKFGPFGLYKYESLWEPAAFSLRISGNQLLIVVILLLISAAFIITMHRLTVDLKELNTLKKDAKALLNRSPMSLAAREEAALVLRSKGMKLRPKFTLALSALVILVILMISLVLGFVWLRMELESQAEGLASESRLLVETLSSSARTSIPAAERGELLLLPEKINALEDALWTTVTGPMGVIENGVLRATAVGSEYIWATNDPDILDKLGFPETLDADSYALSLESATDEEASALREAYQYGAGGDAVLDKKAAEAKASLVGKALRRVNLMPSEAGLGVHRIEDELSEDIELKRQEVEQAVQDAGIARMISELTVLEERYTELAQEVVFTLDFDNPAYVEAEEAVAAQKKEIETLLLEVSNKYFSSYPDFNAEMIRPGGPDVFIFYKPLLYRIGDQDTNFFRGTVRVAVSVESIRETRAMVQKRIILITIIASAAALALGILVAFFIASLIIRPIKSIAMEVEKIREEPNMLKHKEFGITVKGKDEVAQLGDNINDMVMKLVIGAIEQQELVAGQEIQKAFLPLEQVEMPGKTIKLSTGGIFDNPFFRLFGYYEGADAVSGDYFDCRQLDDDHYVMIKLDISGHGVTASMIMVQVAALYVDYFRRVRDKAKSTGRLSYNLSDFVFGINDLLNELGFQGKFAAFNLSVINARTSEYQMIHAGDNLVHVFDGKTRKMKLLELPVSPAAGQVDSEIIRMNPMNYKEVRGSLNRGDVLFLYTDGIEEAHHILRNEKFEVIAYKDLPRNVIASDQEFIEATYEFTNPPERSGKLLTAESSEELVNAALDHKNFRMKRDGSIYKPILADETNEEFDPRRIDDIIEAAMNRTTYTLQRRCDLTIGKPLHFDFTTLKGTGEDAVMALAAVEKVFRIIPDTSAGRTSRVRVDRKIVAFLREHFQEFEEYYANPLDEGDEGYLYFAYLREDPQDDDLTIWSYERL